MYCGDAYSTNKVPVVFICGYDKWMWWDTRMTAGRTGMCRPPGGHIVIYHHEATLSLTDWHSIDFFMSKAMDMLCVANTQPAVSKWFKLLFKMKKVNWIFI